jgi:hypothetical protein
MILTFAVSVYLILMIFLARGAYYFTYAKPGTAKELYFGFRSAPTLDMLFSITAFLLYL